MAQDRAITTATLTHRANKGARFPSDASYDPVELSQLLWREYDIVQNQGCQDQ